MMETYFICYFIIHSVIKWVVICDEGARYNYITSRLKLLKDRSLGADVHVYISHFVMMSGRSHISIAIILDC